jgi:hypothetical protein
VLKLDQLLAVKGEKGAGQDVPVTCSGLAFEVKGVIKMLRPEGETKIRMCNKGEREELREEIEKADQQIDRSLEQVKRSQKSYQIWKLKGSKHLEGSESNLRNGSNL